MRLNNVKKLRKARGLTVSSLAAQAGLSHPYIVRIENGQRGLSIPIAERLAKAMDVSVTELIGLSQSGAPSDVAGLNEDAEPYNEPAGMIVAPRKGTNVVPWRVKTDVLSAAGIRSGDLVFVSLDAATVENLKPLQFVIAQVYDAGEMLQATTILRQFVPPSLLITNSENGNLPSLDINRGDAYVKGVIIGKYSEITSS